MNHSKGILVCIGGAEDKSSRKEQEENHELPFSRYSILNTIVELTQKKEPSVEVITTAYSIPDEYFAKYKKAFKELGCGHVGHLGISKRDEADDKKLVQRINDCDIAMFTGGDQLRLCSILGGTPLLDRLKERYQEEHIVIAGTSAGAAAISNTMICGGNPERSYFKGEVMLSPGFGFLHNAIIDTHFDKPGRFGRLAQAIAAQEGAIGIGLGEDTGVVIEHGTSFRAIGPNSVVVLDGSKVHYNNIAAISDGMPISIGSLVVHILAHADIFDIEKKEG